jgi:hypothetical protein
LGDDLPRGVKMQSDASFARLGITPVAKRLFADLGAIGYYTVDRLEGLALIDENTLAVINDNDFGAGGDFEPATGLLEENPNPTQVMIGIVRLASNGLDASDRTAASTFRTGPC